MNDESRTDAVLDEMKREKYKRSFAVRWFWATQRGRVEMLADWEIQQLSDEDRERLKRL